MSAPQSAPAATEPAGSHGLYEAVRSDVARAEQLNAMLRDHAAVVHNTTEHPALAVHAVGGAR